MRVLKSKPFSFVGKTVLLAVMFAAALGIVTTVAADAQAAPAHVTLAK